MSLTPALVLASLHAQSTWKRVGDLTGTVPCGPPRQGSWMACWSHRKGIAPRHLGIAAVPQYGQPGIGAAVLNLGCGEFCSVFNDIRVPYNSLVGRSTRVGYQQAHQNLSGSPQVLRRPFSTPEGTKPAPGDRGTTLCSAAASPRKAWAWTATGAPDISQTPQRGESLSPEASMKID